MEAYIYKIELNDMIYIGSTKDMKERQWQHNANLKRGCDYPIYKYCRENGINEVELILLECVDIEDKYIVEQYYIDEFKGDKLLNCVNAIFDKKANKEYRKAYYEANKEQIKEKHNEQRKAYRQANKEKIKEHRKAYVEANREKVMARQKAYKQANRDKINECKRLYYARKKAESN